MAKKEDDYHVITRSKEKEKNNSIKKTIKKEKKNNVKKENTVNKKKKKTVKKEKKKTVKKPTIKTNNDDDKLQDYITLLLLLKKISENDEEFNTENIIDDYENFYNNEDSNDEENIIDGESIFKVKNNIDKTLTRKEINLMEKYDKRNFNSTTSFKENILNSNLSDENKVIILKQINYCNSLNENSSEYHKMNLWLKSLEKIPFDNYVKLPVSNNSSQISISNFLSNLQTNLNKCIYGQNKAKESILQIITQIITNPMGTGSIIALKGPPGVGKTSLIKNGLSKSLNIPFSFITLGGISDSSYLDGFSYTYEGSKYGKICETLIQTQCMNPIIFMDELDKVSKTEKGDEINNLLIHLTDFTQNNNFEDKYFSGIPIDLSKTIFIFSLNDEYLINPILKDRLNIINLDKFTTQEKIVIANDYLIPELKNNIGINDNIIFSQENIRFIINNYCPNEPGVRELKRCLETILRKINLLKYSKKITLSYNIKNIKFPLKFNDKIIEELLKEKKINDKTSNLMMYS